MEKTFFNIFDSQIEQVENSAKFYLSGLKDLQKFYLGGVRGAFKLGKSVEDKTKIKVPLMEETSEFFECAAPVALNAQYELAAAAINSGLDVIKAIRENLEAYATPPKKDPDDSCVSNVGEDEEEDEGPVLG